MKEQELQRAKKELQDSQKQLENQLQQLAKRPISELLQQQRNLNTLLKQVAQNVQRKVSYPIYPGTFFLEDVRDDLKVLRWMRRPLRNDPVYRNSVNLDMELVKKFLKDRLEIVGEIKPDRYGNITINVQNIPQKNRNFTV